MTVTERDPYLCAAGSFFLPGLGQVYCGRILRGIVFLIPAVLWTLPYTFVQVAFFYNWLGETQRWAMYLISVVTPIDKIVDFTVRVVSTYDAYKVAKLTKTS